MLSNEFQDVQSPSTADTLVETNSTDSSKGESVDKACQDMTPEEILRNQDISDLICASWEVRENSYSPYSKFKVGASLRTTSGNVYTGTNVENAAYPTGICAERSALV